MEENLKNWFGYNTKIQELKYELRELEKRKDELENNIIRNIQHKGMEKYKFKIRQNTIQLSNRKITQQISRGYLVEQAYNFFGSRQKALDFVEFIYRNRQVNNKLYLSKKKNKK